ncbi:MAG: T9SS type A sorting domain-containing protein [Mucilaginibacter sp.]|nr:T9SS type A sorting domain-containing protein [Mucilaginibacter sp.]
MKKLYPFQSRGLLAFALFYLVTLFFSVPAFAKVSVAYSMMQDTCSPISTLPCASLEVPTPYSLTFDSSLNNSILDKDGLGTGFTTVNTYSGARLSADGQPTNAAIPGYEPSKISIAGGRLLLTAGKGIDYLTNNNQINILGAKIAPAGKLQLETDIVNPLNGTQSQQAGLWFGLNDKTFVKLTISGNKVELRKELNDVSATGNADQRITAAISGLNTKTVRLRIVIDSLQNTVEGFYSTDGGVNYLSAGATYASPSLSISGMGLTTAGAYAGIYATYRNATSAVTYAFDNFSIQSFAAPVVPVSQTVNINFQPSTSSIPAGYLADTGLPFDSTRKYGWISPTTGSPVNLSANMRARTSTGDARQLTLVQMQASASGQVPGTWEYAVANGLYRVTISAGDSGYYDSTNQLNIEGLPTIADFTGSASNKYKTATAVVQVNDGKLTIDATGGVNTKMNYITFEPATTVTDVTKPTTTARFVGTAKGTNTYEDQAQVFLSATDAGGSGLATFQYSLNNAAYVDYKAPFVVTAPGTYSMNVNAVDGNGNQTVNTYNFTVVAAPTNGAYMVLKNMDNFPSNDRLVFSLIQAPWRRVSPDTTPYNANHDKVRLRINNKGTGKLTVSNLKLSNVSSWKIVSVGTDTLAKVPFSVNTGAYTDVTIQFKAKDAASRLKVFTDTLTITSNDSAFAVKKVILSGIWQKEGEGVNEPYAQQIITAFGFGTTVGYAHDDNGNKGTTKMPSSSEINGAFFTKADPARPITVVQVAAYHGCCSAVESIRYYKKGSTSSSNIVTHNNLDGQSVLPRITGSSTNLAQATFDPTGVFGFKVGSSNSDRTQNFNGLIGIRFLKAFDGAGNIIPNAYFLDCDYLGTSFTNYDYQDNIYYVENIKPDSGTVYNSILGSVPVTAVNFNTTLVNNTSVYQLNLKNLGQTYPNGTSDPVTNLKSAQIVGPNASEFSIPAFGASTLNAQATRTVNVTFKPTSIGIKNATLLVNYNSAASPLRIPLYGVANTSTQMVNVVKRIKGGSDVNVTIGGLPYEADKNYRKGSIKLDKQTITSEVLSTDIDTLYQTYLSAAADLAETRYEIPITNGSYLLRMHFVENYWTAPGQRVFGINVENVPVLTNFDIFNEVGYRRALVKDFATTVNDGVLTIKFNPTANRVGIAGLEIFNLQDVPMFSAFASSFTNAPVSLQKTFIAYPNPNLGDMVNLQLSNFGKQEKVNIAITDTWGKPIQQHTLTTDESGNINTPITFRKALTKGVYIINAVSASGTRLYSKLIVQ